MSRRYFKVIANLHFSVVNPGAELVELYIEIYVDTFRRYDFYYQKKYFVIRKSVL